MSLEFRKHILKKVRVSFTLFYCYLACALTKNQHINYNQKFSEDRINI